MKKECTGIAIIGGGVAGLAAAISAVESGVSAMVIEKTDNTGSSASVGMGLLAVESHFQKTQMVDLTVDEAFEEFMTYTHWRVDARLVKKYLEKSANTIEWLERIGVQFVGAYKYFKDSHTTWHCLKQGDMDKPTERAGWIMLDLMREHAISNGVKFHTNTRASKILMDGGHAVGVLAETNKEEYLEIKSDAVIVCTGGYGANSEMIKEHLGYEWGKDLFSYRIPGIVGDGLKLAWEAGAGSDNMIFETNYRIPGVSDVYKVLSETMRQPNLMVNLNGKRFLNEGILGNPTFTSNAISRQRKRCAFTIIDDSILGYYKKNGLDYYTFCYDIVKIDRFEEELAAYVAGSEKTDDVAPQVQEEKALLGVNVFIADSLDDLAAQAGIDSKNLCATVNEYIRYGYSYDPLFNKPARFMKPIAKPRYIAARHFPAGYGSQGGIRANDNLEVMTESDEVIPGLYAAGNDANGIYGDSYVFILPGNTMGFAMNSGRIAGENAARYVSSKQLK